MQALIRNFLEIFLPAWSTFFFFNNSPHRCLVTLFSLSDNHNTSNSIFPQKWLFLIKKWFTYTWEKMLTYVKCENKAYASSWCHYDERCVLSHRWGEIETQTNTCAHKHISTLHPEKTKNLSSLSNWSSYSFQN